MDAWRAFHQHIEEAKAAIGGPGLFVDVHGHGHPGMRAEFGYLIKVRHLTDAARGCSSTQN